MTNKIPTPTRPQLLGLLHQHGNRQLVADAEGVSLSTVRNWCSFCGITSDDYEAAVKRSSRAASKEIPKRKHLIDVLNYLGSQAQASRLYEVSPDTMTRWCRRLSIRANDYDCKHPGLKRPSKAVFMAAMESRSQRELAKHFNVNHTSVVKWAAYYNLEFPSALCLEESDIPLIRELFADGIKRMEIAKKFEVRVEVIRDVIKGRTWSWVK